MRGKQDLQGDMGVGKIAGMNNELLQLTRDLVAIPSVNPQERAWTDEPYGEKRVAGFVYDWFRKQGLEAGYQYPHPERPNVVVQAEGEDSSRTLVLCAHLDTVDVQDMVISPFDPVVNEGRLFGRGSCDTKASLAVMMTAFRDRVKSGKALPCNLTFLASAGEEYDTLGAEYFVNHLEGDVCAAIFGEPTELNPVIAHKGVVRLKITATGKSAHSSNPKLGENAIYRLNRAIDFTREYDERLAAGQGHELLGHETVSVTIVRGGQQINVIPDKAEALLDWRILPGRSGKACVAEFAEGLGKACAEGALSCTLVNEYLGMETDAESGVVEQLLRAARKEYSQAQPIAVHYGTDAGPFSHLNIPTPIFGPGSIAQAHSADEFIEIEQLEKGRLILVDFLNSQWV